MTGPTGPVSPVSVGPGYSVYSLTTPLPALSKATMTTAPTALSTAPSSNTYTPGSGAASDSTEGLGKQTDLRHQYSAAWHVDVEKLKFRFVFILWPALMGITMAM